MVISAYGVDISEADLRAACDCTMFGTHALKMVDAARKLGFPHTTKHNLSLDQLKTLIEDRAYPIVFVNLIPIDGIDESHALVVHEFGADSIVVCDPAVGERNLRLQPFAAAWALRRNLAVLVKR